MSAVSAAGARAPAFSPLPLRALLGRIEREWSRERRIFDLPAGRFFDVSSAAGLATTVLGRRVATPLGPAAGPHTQLAQNIVLGWLAGARVVELKTVQARDRLEIVRPCIDMAGVGYNVEWSQELSLAESREEYVKAWMAIDILRARDELRPVLGPDPGAPVFDLSVGYDLAGISSDAVAAFIDALTDAADALERLRADVGGAFAAQRDRPFETRLIGSATLSTFHGCPPGEIAAMARRLMTRHGLDVVVKLNPTLLGRDRVAGILADELGYRELRLRSEDFEADLGLAAAVDLIRDLEAFARTQGRRFGVKLTNTLVVANHRGVLPADPMYLSGPPLHVLAVTLLDVLHRRLPGTLAVGADSGPVDVSFSAGVTKRNVAAVAGMGVAPITVCSDLLRPAGYGRLGPMLSALADAMRAAGCADLAAWRRHRDSEAAAAGHPDAVAAYSAELHTATGRAAYARAAVAKPLRHVDHRLAMWGCIACNACVAVCPNDAFTAVPTPPSSGLAGDRQYVRFAELCNHCGNCATFCPEAGDPARVKPSLFLRAERFALGDEPGFLLSSVGGRLAVTASPGLEPEAARVEALLAQGDGALYDPEDLVSSRVGAVTPA